jgi:Cytochrome P450
MFSLAARHTHWYANPVPCLNKKSLSKLTRPDWVDTSIDDEIGIPHQLEKDDIWNGYFIPKGAYIHAVEWYVPGMINEASTYTYMYRSLARDPAVYPNPDTFNPGRYLDPKYPTYREPLSEFPTIRGYHGFGFGRRICPGQEVAEAELLVACAAIVWAFRLERKRTASGEEMRIPDYDFTSTLITTAKPFDHAIYCEVREARANHSRQIPPSGRARAEWN